MTIWRGKTAMPSVGPQFHVSYKAFGGGPDYSADVAQSMGLARIMIREILRLLKGGFESLTLDQKQVFDYYFCMNGEPTSTDVTIVRETLTLIANGLNGQDLNVKVSSGNDGTIGYVNRRTSQVGSVKKLFGKKASTPGTVLAKDDGGNLAGGSGKAFRGDIHIGRSRLDTGPELSAKTIIHEASHKFASTADFGEKGYTYDDDGLFREPGLTHAEALNNAESYARFVMMAFLFPNG
ncbi:MAG: hypothetical protein ACYCZB_14650 [Acidiphilium sp.]